MCIISLFIEKIKRFIAPLETINKDTKLAKLFGLYKLKELYILNNGIYNHTLENLWFFHKYYL